MTPLRRRTILTALLAGGTVTACTDRDGTSAGKRADGGASGGSDGGGAPDPGVAAVTSTYMLLGSEVTVGVRPLVRSGEHLVLTIDLSAAVPESDSGEESALRSSGLASRASIQWNDGWGSTSGDVRDYLGVRLLDLETDLVASTAVDADGGTVGTHVEAGQDEPSDAEESQSGVLRGTVQIAFADPGADSLSVFVPKLPLFTDVPVIDADVPAVAGAEEHLDLSRIEEAPLAPMLSLSQDLEEPIREQRDAEVTTVTISSDVLFDSSSSTLDGTARGALDKAARRIESHQPGPVRIIGHTDDIDFDGFNMTLSTHRAQAVADALEDRLGADEYELSIEGRGETEPVATNDSPEGRALNRRVEIALETAIRTEAAEEEQMPEFDGKVAAAADGVRFDGTERAVVRPFDLQLSSARMVQGHLVVTLEVTPLDEEHDGAYGIGQFDEGLALPREPDGVNDVTLLASNGGVGVLVGSVITYPAFHRAGGPGDTIRPLTDLSANSTADGGEPRIVELVYARDIPGVREGVKVALHYGTVSEDSASEESGWRLTDVPVGA